MTGAARRPAWIEVDLDAIAHNMRIVRDHVGGDRQVLAVVKADAYGHGAAAVARRLEAEGAALFGVAIPEEGHALRAAGITTPILVLGAADRSQIPSMTGAGLIPTAFGASFLKAILDAGARAERPLPFHLKVDTGMGRLGLLPEELPGSLAAIAAAGDRVTLDGVFTTLSSADDPDDPYTLSQIARFESALEEIRKSGLAPRWIHVANSGGIIDHPPSWLRTVRPGIMLYGLHPSSRSTRLDLRPALSVKCRLVLVKSVAAGTPIGYGRGFVARRPSRIGTIPVGYADGLARLVAEEGHALVGGARAPYTGRISMDHAMLDLTDLPHAAEQDEVVLLGRQGDEEVSADMMAGWARTISYEVVSRLGPRLARVHIQRG